MRPAFVKNVKEDPSDIKQLFTTINIQLHCCRYWILTEWECINMAFPFWRLYHNNHEGATIIFYGETFHLQKDTIILIPPNTSFSTKLRTAANQNVKESIVGRKINSFEEILQIDNEVFTDHLFIHFNLGYRFDSVVPGVYAFKANDNMLSVVQKVKELCVEGLVEFDFKSSAIINNLILTLLVQIDNRKWVFANYDKRIQNALHYIDNNIKEYISNHQIAAVGNMAINSFARRFKETVGVSVQQYIVKVRIEKARLLMHHSNKSIDEIAIECGFYDRHHFSKVFKNVLNVSPGYYKQHLTLG